MAKKQAVKKKNVIFVCTGNTCRSPMAEILFRYFLGKKRKLSKYDVSSAGLCANEGEPISENALGAMKALGVPVKGKHVAHVLTRGAVEKADLIVCMTASHAAALGEYAQKVKTVGEITASHDVPDPYGGNLALYVQTAEYLLYACEEIFNFAEKISV